MARSRFALLALCLAAVSRSAGGQWTEIEEAKLVASDASSNNWFGTSVAVEGDTLVVGAPGADVAGLADVGAAYVFVNGSAGWSEAQKLTPLVPAAGDAFGTAVAIDAGRIFVGAPLRDVAGVADAGAVEVFVGGAASWVQAQDLMVPTPKQGQRFGSALAIDSDTLLCGAPVDFSSPQASSATEAFVFVQAAGSWTHQATLPYVTYSWWGGEFGAAVALEGDRAVVGAPEEISAGIAAVYSRTGTTWALEDVLDPRGPDPTGYLWTQYGRSVSVSGKTVLAGAPRTLIGSWYHDAGSVQLHELKGTKWAWKAGFVNSVPINGHEYGDSIARDGNLVAIGAPGPNKGHAYVRSGSGTTWKKIAKLEASDGKYGDRFGDTVAIEHQRVVIGAPLHGTKDAGAAYVYALVAPPPAIYCTSGTSASGCRPVISTAGQPSASALNGFVISTNGIEGGRPGMLIYGTTGKQALPWGSGTSYLCIVPPLHYGGALPGTGTHGNCDGSFAVDLNALWCPSCPKAATNPGESGAVQAQLWYRDPLSTSGETSSLTDAVQLWVGP